MIAIDKMNDELYQVIRYLASCASGIHLEAIELNVYTHGDTQVVAPEIHGREIPSDQTRTLKLSIEQVLESCANQHERSLLDALIEQWKTFGHAVEPGTKGISFRARIGDEFRPVFWAPNPQFVNVDFNWLHDEGVTEEVLKSYRDRVATIKGFDRQKVMTQTAPRLYLADADAEGAKQVAQVNHELVMVWRNRIEQPRTENQ
jgi:hypothetical protein